MVDHKFKDAGTRVVIEGVPHRARGDGAGLRRWQDRGPYGVQPGSTSAPGP